MSRAFATIESVPKVSGAARPVQRRCASCGDTTRSLGFCPKCEGRKRYPPVQTRLQVSTPGDAGEREAERAADDVMQGRTPAVLPRPAASLLQRDTSDAAPVPTDPEQQAPAPAAPPAEEVDAATATPTCTPKALKRADYLNEPGTSTNDFGLTTLNVSSTTFPAVVTTRKAKGGLKLEPTTAALPTIPSIHTGADTFIEGEAVFIDQDGTTGCPSGHKLPIRWFITGSGSDKIREGEQEHCSDFQLAFDLSLKRYAEAVNALAASGRTFASQKAAEKAVTAKVGAPPDQWFDVFLCLTRKTLLRDSRDLHKPRPQTRGPRPGGPCEVRAIIGATSLPRVGQIASADLIKDCNEAGPAKPAGKQPGKEGQAPGGIVKPDLSGTSWETGGTEELQESDEALLLQRSADRAASTETPIPAIDLVDAALASTGQVLDPDCRVFMESRFACDFSRVRVHDDESAVASARALHASAYTVGHDIVFDRGAYAPHTERGRHLLAHELAHVVQQSARPSLSSGLQRFVQRQPTSLSAIPEAERRAIQVGTIAVTVPPARITAFFTIMSSGRPSESRSIGATNSFDPAIPAALHTGLGSIAAYIAGDTNALPANTSIEVDLDLSAHGGARTTYRFTRFTHTTGTGSSASSSAIMLIEQIGATPAAPAAMTVPSGGTFSIGSTNFSLAGRWNDGDFTLLHQALGQLPATALSAAAGLTFRRTGSATGPEAGHYDSSTDSVELNNLAFPTTTDLRFGQRPPALRNVLHEVGHAIDLRVLERAWQAYTAAGQTPAARQTLLAVRSPSGSRWGAATDGSGNDEIQENAADTRPAFRAAVRRDGVRPDTSGRVTPEGTTATLSGGITTYSDTDYQELYAESFAMYVAAPETLRQLRPATFAYFQSQYPSP